MTTIKYIKWLGLIKTYIECYFIFIVDAAVYKNSNKFVVIKLSNKAIIYRLIFVTDIWFLSPISGRIHNKGVLSNGGFYNKDYNKD